MNGKVILILLLMTFNIGEVEQLNITYTNSIKYELSNYIISSSKVDYDDDGINEVINIILAEGYFINDQELWSGKGPKWVGDFAIQVLDDNKEVHFANLNKLLYTEEPIFFYFPDFELKFIDYNNDENLDFTLVQYYSSNGSEYYPLSIDSKGVISRLEIDDSSAFFISPGTRHNSVVLPIETDRISIYYYDNWDGEYKNDYYLWSVKDEKFILDERKIIVH